MLGNKKVNNKSLFPTQRAKHNKNKNKKRSKAGETEKGNGRHGHHCKRRDFQPNNLKAPHPLRKQHKFLLPPPCIIPSKQGKRVVGEVDVHKSPPVL
jgi:hypothetical protein